MIFQAFCIRDLDGIKAITRQYPASSRVPAVPVNSQIIGSVLCQQSIVRSNKISKPLSSCIRDIDGITATTQRVRGTLKVMGSVVCVPLLILIARSKKKSKLSISINFIRDLDGIIATTLEGPRVAGTRDTHLLSG